jgi:predicted porin
MKKSLIALAVLAASGVASAQSTVTLYGLVDAYVGAIKTGGGTATAITNGVVNSGGFQTSRFGFKGSEDLGGGLKANFLLEGGFGVDNGASGGYTNVAGTTTATNLFSRQSYVGFSGGFGEVKIGKMWTAYDDQVGAGLAAFNANQFVPTANVWVSSNAYNGNPGNSIYYSTPDFGGFTAAASYSLGENKAPGVKAGKIAAFNVAYSGGPVFASLAYQSEQPTGAATTTKFTEINGSYDFGVAKLLAAYGHVKGAVHTKEYQVGVDVPLGSALTISGGYAHSKDENTAPVADVTRKGFGVAGLYALSKRTNLYVGAQNNKSTNVAVGKGYQYGLGVRHTF